MRGTAGGGKGVARPYAELKHVVVVGGGGAKAEPEQLPRGAN